MRHAAAMQAANASAATTDSAQVEAQLDALRKEVAKLATAVRSSAAVSSEVLVCFYLIATV